LASSNAVHQGVQAAENENISTVKVKGKFTCILCNEPMLSF